MIWPKGRRRVWFIPLPLLHRTGGGRCTCPWSWRVLVVACSAYPLLLAACGTPSNPPLSPKPTTPPNAGPVTAPDGETPEQAAIRLFPAARARELALGASPQELSDARPGRPVPVARDYRSEASVARWVLPDDERAVSGDMFAAMWPIAMARDAFVVPFARDGRVIGLYGVELHGDSWAYARSASSSLHTSVLCTLQTATEKLTRVLGEGTEVRPVVFAPSGIAFAVGDNQGREAAVVLGYTNLGPGIDAFNGPNWPPPGRLFTPEQLKTLLAGG